MRRLPALLAAVLLAAGAVAARAALEPEATARGAIRNPAWLPDGKLLRVASFGQRTLLADLYWLRLVQYMGETLLARSDRWEATLPLAEIVTDLDPRYGYAYQVAGSNLAGLAHRYGEAETILRKGIRNLPDRWILQWTMAVNKFLYEGDYKAAAAWAREAAEVGKRPHLALLAANLSLVTNQEEEYAAAKQVLAIAIEQAEQPELKEQLEARLVKVLTYERIAEVERALQAYQARYVLRPLSVEELVAEGLLPAIPRDPSGGRIVLDLATGEVRSTVLGKREPIRAEP